MLKITIIIGNILFASITGLTYYFMTSKNSDIKEYIDNLQRITTHKEEDKKTEFDLSSNAKNIYKLLLSLGNIINKDLWINKISFDKDSKVLELYIKALNIESINQYLSDFQHIITDRNKISEIIIKTKGTEIKEKQKKDNEGQRIIPTVIARLLAQQNVNNVKKKKSLDSKININYVYECNIKLSL